METGWQPQLESRGCDTVLPDRRLMGRYQCRADAVTSTGEVLGSNLCRGTKLHIEIVLFWVFVRR
jgi:hypothetical protein